MATPRRRRDHGRAKLLASEGIRLTRDAPTAGVSGYGVIVAGGGRGIGRACSLMLAAHGAQVLVADPGVAHDGTGGDGGIAKAVAAEIRAAGGTAVGVADAIGLFADGERIVARCLEEFGRVDAVLSPAAILREAMIFNTSEDDWQSLLGVNLTGVYGLVRAACVEMRKHARGRIVTFASAAGLEGRAGTSAYAATKAGVVGLTKSVAREVDRDGIRINCIVPRADTRLTAALPSLGPPENVARLAVVLASERCPCTGRVFFCGGREIGLYADFVPERLVALDGGDATRLVMEQLLG